MKATLSTLLILSGLLVNGQTTLLTESFDGTTFPPTNWNRITNCCGASWNRSTSTTYSGAGCAYIYGSTDDEDTWLFTPDIAMTAGNTYRIEYYQRTGTATWDPASMKVTVGMGQSIAAQTTTLQSYCCLSNTSYTLRQHDFVCPANGTYNFAFHCYSSDFQSAWLRIDEVEVLDMSPAGCSPLAGTYTIGGASPDYVDFQDAVDDLINCGVSAAVTFNVRSGTYEEQLSIPAISGASATNTITFQSQTGTNTDVILEYDPNSTLNYVLELTSADYFTFQNMTLRVKTPTNSYGRVVLFTGDSDHNTFDNNIFDSGLEAFSNKQTIYKFISGDRCDYNTISNNIITGGTAGIWWNGSSSSLQFGNQFLNNTLSRHYYQGLRVAGQQGVVVSGNQVTMTQNYTQYAIYLRQCDNEFTCVKNTISISGTGSFSPVGIYVYQSDGSFSNRGLIANNFIMMDNGTGTFRGIFYNDSEYQNCYYNSVWLGGGNATSRGLSTISSVNNLTVRNNIFSTTAGNYAMYLSESSAPVASNTYNYNDLYTTGPNLVYYASADYANLAAWQTTPHGANSISADPIYTSTSDLHIANGSSPVVDQAVMLADVTDDIDGDLRNPDIGADEYISPLPVELIHFTATAVDNREVLIRWTTASEINNDYFEILKSDNGHEFKRLSTVNGNGNSSDARYYSIVDHNPVKGVNYYRLRQVDFDGTTTETRIEVAEIAEKGSATVSIFPNPADDLVMIQHAAKGNWQLFNAQGKLVNESQYNGDFRLNIASLEHGVYVLRLVSDQGTFVQSLVIEHR